MNDHEMSYKDEKTINIIISGYFSCFFKFINKTTLYLEKV